MTREQLVQVLHKHSREWGESVVPIRFECPCGWIGRTQEAVHGHIADAILGATKTAPLEPASLREAVEKLAQQEEPGVIVGTCVVSYEVTRVADDGDVVHGHRHTYWGNPFAASSLAAITSADIIQVTEPE